jgi:hypothetical protein
VYVRACIVREHVYQRLSARACARMYAYARARKKMLACVLVWLCVSANSCLRQRQTALTFATRVATCQDKLTAGVPQSRFCHGAVARSQIAGDAYLAEATARCSAAGWDEWTNMHGSKMATARDYQSLP